MHLFRRPVQKWLALGLLALATVAITSALLSRRSRAQSRPAAAAARAVPGAPAIRQVMVNRPGGPRAAGLLAAGPQGAQDPSVRMVGRFHRVKVRAVGRRALIEAGAELYERDPGKRYVWVLRLIGPRPDRRVLSERVYRDQVFTLPVGQQQASPTFSDAIELPPGRHLIRVELHEVTGDLATWEPTGRHALSGYREVTIE
jgi:hypothetical protein